MSGTEGGRGVLRLLDIMVEQSGPPPPNQTSEKGACRAAGSRFQSGWGDSPTYSDAKRLDFTAALSAQIKALHRFKPDFGRQGERTKRRFQNRDECPSCEGENISSARLAFRARERPVGRRLDPPALRRRDRGGMCDVHRGNRSASPTGEDRRVPMETAGKKHAKRTRLWQSGLPPFQPPKRAARPSEMAPSQMPPLSDGPGGLGDCLNP